MWSITAKKTSGRGLLMGHRLSSVTESSQKDMHDVRAHNRGNWQREWSGMLWSL